MLKQTLPSFVVEVVWVPHSRKLWFILRVELYVATVMMGGLEIRGLEGPTEVHRGRNWLMPPSELTRKRPPPKLPEASVDSLHAVVSVSLPCAGRVGS